MTIAFDANIWISFTIGKRLATLKDLLLNLPEQAEILVYYCPEILSEYHLVVKRPKLRRYISAERVEETVNLITRVTEYIELDRIVSGSRDPKDNYLLALAEQVPLNYLVTGDRDLLDLKTWHQTRIISFVQFEEILANEQNR